MKLKKLLAAVTAAALAITTMAVTSFTASADTANGTHTFTNPDTFFFTDEENKFDYKEYSLTQAQIGKAINHPGAFINSVASITVNYEASADISGIIIAHGSDEANGWWAEESVSISQGSNSVTTAKPIKVDNGAVDFQIKTVNSDTNLIDKTLKINSVTLTGVGYVSEKIDAANFTYSTLNNTSMAVGDKFTIAYDSTGTPATAKYNIKYEWNDGSSTQYGNAYVGGAIDNSSENVLGVKVTSATAGKVTTYTFTATGLSEYEFAVKIEASAKGDFSDIQYLWFGSNPAYKVTTGGTPDPTMTVSPKTLTVAEGATGTITMTAANADGYTFTAASSDATKATVTETATDNKFTVTGVAAGTATITVTGAKSGADNITATCEVTVTAAGGEDPDDPTPPPVVDPDTPTPPAGDTTGSYTGPVSEGNQPSFPITITPGSGKTLADIRSVTATVTLSDGSWGGGCLGMNVDGNWTAENWSNEAAMTVTIQTPNGVSDDDAGSCQFQIWWLGNSNGDGTVNYAISYTYSDGSSGGGTDTPPSVGGNSVTMGSTDYDGWFEAILTKDQLLGGNTDAATITFTGADLAKVGYNSISEGGYKGIDCTGTVTVQVSDIDLSDNFYFHVGGGAATVVTWSFSGGSSGTPDTPPIPDTPPNPDTPPSAPSGPSFAPSIPSSSVPSNSASSVSVTVVDKILSTPDGGSSSVTLGSNTKLDKAVIEALATKGDITVRFNVSGGAYWEINGTNVTDAKAVDLGVKLNGNLIPESKIKEFAGDKTAIQFNLKHNGDFGFMGLLSVPVGKSNDGKFANLYYYHGGQFDFVGSSSISDGRAKFKFSHASNYLILIDDYAYGEDVSSAAGITEVPETSAVPFAAALVVVSAFGISAIIFKKRLSK